MKNILIIANPGSGKNEAKVYATQLERLLIETYQASVEIRLTEKEGDALEWARKANEEQFDTVICLGGDGTVNETVQGVVTGKGAVNFGFVPLGTVNDLARAIGYELDPEKAIHQFKQVQPVGLDVAKVNDTFFINVLAIGSIPESVMNTDSQDKNRLGSLAYIKDAIGAFFSEQSLELVIEHSGGREEVTTSLLLVALTNSVGGYEAMLPHAHFNDGQLYLAAIKGGAPKDMIMALFEGSVPREETETILVLKDTHFRIYEKNSSNEVITTNIDGDQGPQLPIEIQILPSAIKVLQPIETK